MRTVVGPVTVHVDGEPLESETTACALGPNVVAVSTALPEIGVIATTTYTGADDVTTTAVDLILAPRPNAVTRSRTIPRDSVPVTHDRQQCLLDHAHQLMIDLRAHDGRRYTVDVSEGAVERAAAI